MRRPHSVLPISGLLLCLGLGIFFWVGCSANFGKIKSLQTFKDKGSRYEVWYYRVQDDNAKVNMVFIYGLYRPEGQNQPAGGFIQCLNAVTGEMLQETFPAEAVPLHNELNRLALGPNLATKYNFNGALKQNDKQCRWQLKASRVTLWQDKLIGSSILGVGGLHPGLKSYWDVTALTSEISGEIEWNGVRFTFDKAQGYMERRWGKEPAGKRMFLQLFNFGDQPGTLTLTGEYASISKLGNWLYTIALQTGSDFLQYRTTDLDRIASQVEPGRWTIDANNVLQKISIEVTYDPVDLREITVPGPAGLTSTAYYTFQGHVKVTLSRKSSKHWQPTRIIKADQVYLEMVGPGFF